MGDPYEIAWEELGQVFVESMEEMQIPIGRENVMNRTNIRSCLTPFHNANLITHGLHMMRAGIYSAKIMKHLGFQNQYWKNVLFTGNSIHDRRKALPIEGFNPFSRDAWMFFDVKQHMPIVKKHVLVNEYPMTPDFGEDVKAIEAWHHAYQPEPYFGDRRQLSPEQRVAAQISALIDGHDALSTRRRKIPGLDIERCLLPSPETIVRTMIEKYGGMQISYSGTALPNMNLSGEQFIEMCYESGIFRDNTLAAGVWPAYKLDARALNYVPGFKSLHDLASRTVLKNRLNPFS